MAHIRVNPATSLRVPLLRGTSVPVVAISRRRGADAPSGRGSVRSEAASRPPCILPAKAQVRAGPESPAVFGAKAERCITRRPLPPVRRPRERPGAAAPGIEKPAPTCAFPLGRGNPRRSVALPPPVL
ncbi:hypothetical protein FM110_13290 [Brachybacterium nesterenkovii]|uniref:Uncharacterized protein n=1 Tax=Brachybacterium nesterenkovii TaxID=47847 RepID=A0A1X6X9B5_9MICO|nr:hypothetical protein FM110_13290 [Brachybacterium nesterenkovii]